jgi:hypothetical protein
MLATMVAVQVAVAAAAVRALLLLLLLLLVSAGLMRSWCLAAAWAATTGMR